MQTSTTALSPKTENQPIIWLAIAVVFWVANVTLHLEFSNWLVRPYNSPFGEFVPRDFSTLVAVVCNLALITWLSSRIRIGDSRHTHSITWALWFATALIAFSFIMTTTIEAIHYLQYGILAWLLARAIDPKRQDWPLLTLLSITVGLGIIDELNQYFLLTPGNSTYIDFNDFVLNLIGAQAGLFAYYSGLQYTGGVRFSGPKSVVAKITLTCYAIFGLVVLVLVMLGRLSHTPPVSVPAGGMLHTGGTWTIFLEREAGLLESWQTSFDGGQYYVLGVVGGISTMIILTVLTQCFKYAARKST